MFSTLVIGLVASLSVALLWGLIGLSVWATKGLALILIVPVVVFWTLYG